MKRKEIKDLLLLKLSLISLCMLIFAAIFAEEISLDFILAKLVISLIAILYFYASVTLWLRAVMVEINSEKKKVIVILGLLAFFNFGALIYYLFKCAKKM